MNAADEQTWTPDWEALAHRIVDETLRIGPDDRVIYLIDPFLVPELFEEVRRSVLRNGAVEQATMLSWTQGLAAERDKLGAAVDPMAKQREAEAHKLLFDTANVFMWLPTSFFYLGAVTTWESESILADWDGRGIHFHWFPEPGTVPDDPINLELQKIYSRAILDLDYAAHSARQHRLVERIRGRKVHVTRPEGTDLQFELDPNGWYHINDGDASPERVARTAQFARDREQELPCGAVRTVPVADSVNGIVSFRSPVAYNGFGLPLSEWWDDLDLVFDEGHITAVRSSTHQDAQETFDQLRGDKDRLGEIVIGTNPLLENPPGARMPTYWGFGAGNFRFHLGENIESGGTFRTEDLWMNVFATDVTMTVDDEIIIQDGTLLFE